MFFITLLKICIAKFKKTIYMVCNENHFKRIYSVIGQLKKTRQADPRLLWYKEHKWLDFSCNLFPSRSICAAKKLTSV